MSEAALRPAATLIVMRDRDDGPAEILMIKRAATMAFGADAWVFPGGKVDPEDVAFAAQLTPQGGDAEDIAARIAAIRETIEEAGVPVGLDPLPDPATLAAIRAGLHERRSLKALLEEAGLAIILDNLVPFARWVPPLSTRRRFDTRFYVAQAPADAVIEADGTESIAICWAAAADMLSRREARIMFPTASNLRRLVDYPDFARVAAHAAQFPPDLLMAEIREIDGARYLCVPEGRGYPDVRQLLDTVVRG